MGYYSALQKEKGIPTHATASMNLENLTLSKISQSQENKDYATPLVRGI